MALTRAGANGVPLGACIKATFVDEPLEKVCRRTNPVNDHEALGKPWAAHLVRSGNRGSRKTLNQLACKVRREVFSF